MTLYRWVIAAVVVSLAPWLIHGAPAPKETVKAKTPEVHAIGVYEGTYPPNIMHQGNFHPPGAISVKVGEVAKPVILVLTSYEPVVWTVDDPKGAVVRVIASGYYKQAVAGLRNQVPVTFISLEAGDKAWFFAYRKEANPNENASEQTETKMRYDRLVERVKELTDHDIKEFQGEYRGSTFEIK